MDRGRWIVEQQGGLAWWAPAEIVSLCLSASWDPGPLLGRVSPAWPPGRARIDVRLELRWPMLDDRCVEARVGQVDCSTSTLSRDAVCRMPMCLKGWQSG